MTAGIVDIAIANTGTRVTNDFFDEIGLTDDWIRRRTGVAARWWMDPDEPLEAVAARVCETKQETVFGNAGGAEQAEPVVRTGLGP